MNWHIGQDIVAIATHYDGYFKEGDTFTILCLRTSPCKCRKVQIDIGSLVRSQIGVCSICGGDVDFAAGIRWHGEEDFAPLDSLTNISELTELLNNTTAFELNQ